MNTFIIIALIFFILLKIYELFFSVKNNNPHFNNSQFNIESVNAFIRKEASFEILKWMTTNRFQRNADTGDPSFITQMTNSEEVKKKTSVITNIISEKMSPELHAVFNKYFAKDLSAINNSVAVDISLSEYIARYVFFIFRRLVYDITKTIDSEEYKEIRLNEILNVYIVSLEETIYSENNIYLIAEEHNNVDKSGSI
jgi:hypothetical protein